MFYIWVDGSMDIEGDGKERRERKRKERKKKKGKK